MTDIRYALYLRGELMADDVGRDSVVWSGKGPVYITYLNKLYGVNGVDYRSEKTLVFCYGPLFDHSTLTYEFGGSYRCSCGKEIRPDMSNPMADHKAMAKAMWHEHQARRAGVTA